MKFQIHRSDHEGAITIQYFLIFNLILGLYDRKWKDVTYCPGADFCLVSFYEIPNLWIWKWRHHNKSIFWILKLMKMRMDSAGRVLPRMGKSLPQWNPTKKKTDHGFQLSGNGALMPSLATHNNSGSRSGSMPITWAYS